MDPHQKLKQEYLKTQSAAHAAWVEDQARHTVKRTTKPQQVTSTNFYNHKDPDKTTDNPSSNTQGMYGSRADSPLPVENVTTPAVINQATIPPHRFFTWEFWKRTWADAPINTDPIYQQDGLWSY